MQDYTVKLDAFEGPMDLLMHLIEKNKIDIYDIPMAVITEQYIDYLNRFREFNIEVASEFIVMAATLLQIKSRLMLPKPPKEADEEPEADPWQELIDRIIEYRRFKAVSSVLDDMAREQGRFFARLPADLPIHHLPPENMPLSALVEAFCAVIRVREELKLPEALVAREEYSIQDKITELLALLQRAHGRILFSDAFVSGSRSELITTFLALLELIKLKTVLVQQPGQFAAIYISTRDGEHGCL